MAVCCVVETDCLAPANALVYQSARCKCFRCGEDVCRNCSKVQPYLKYGRRRICNRCIAEMDR